MPHPATLSSFLNSHRRRTHAEFETAWAEGTVCTDCPAWTLCTRSIATVPTLAYADPHPSNTAQWCFGWVPRDSGYNDEPI